MVGVVNYYILGTLCLQDCLLICILLSSPDNTCNSQRIHYLHIYQHNKSNNQIVQNTTQYSTMNNLQLWSSGTEVLPLGHFTSLGLSQETAESLYIFQIVLSTTILKNYNLITKLKRLKREKDEWDKVPTERRQDLQPPNPSRHNIEKEFVITIKGHLPEGLPYHSSLLPLWNQFADTLWHLST